MRDAMKRSILAAAVLPLLAPFAPVRAAETKPNIVIVFMDEGDQWPCVDEDHGRLRARSTSIS